MSKVKYRAHTWPLRPVWLFHVNNMVEANSCELYFIKKIMKMILSPFYFTQKSTETIILTVGAQVNTINLIIYLPLSEREQNSFKAYEHI